ncbi:MAG: protein dithiol-disulfide isomerase [Pseudonocardiales bacterium]|nr:protein dithiol-disulfide isomerase [Pseudonocardiales bacterium]
MQVEIWSDVVCPWCYLGKRRFENALASFAHRDDVDVVYRSFELDPSAAPGVTTPTVDLLASKYGMSVQQAHDAQQQMERRAEQDGLTFHMDGLRSGNTRDAHRLLQLAKVGGRQPELAERLHKAYFTDQISIFDHTSLADLAAEVGLDRDEVARVLSTDDYDDEVQADEDTARSLGATGVPFFVIDRHYGISGAQPAETIKEILDRAWADSQTQAS